MYSSSSQDSYLGFPLPSLHCVLCWPHLFLHTYLALMFIQPHPDFASKQQSCSSIFQLNVYPWMFFKWLKHVASKSCSSPPTLIISPSWFYCPSPGILGYNLGSPTLRRNLNSTRGMATTDLKGEWSSPLKEFQLLVYLKWLPNWDIEKIFFVFPVSHIIRTRHLIGHDSGPNSIVIQFHFKRSPSSFKKQCWKGKGLFTNI